MSSDPPEGPSNGRNNHTVDGKTTESPQDPGGPSRFETELARLERSGATLLVVSTAPKEVTRRLCRTMLGSSQDIPRRRVLGLTGCEVGTTEARLQAGAKRDARHLQVVDFEMDTRSVAEDTACDHPRDRADTTASAGSGSVPRTEMADESLAGFGAAIAEAVDGVVGGIDLDPQELRVCVDSLDTLLDAFGSENIQRFVHVLGNLVSRHDGLAHLHLDVSADHPDVSMLAPLCDIVVEVRTTGDSPVYRLSITDGPASEWLPIDGGP